MKLLILALLTTQVFASPEVVLSPIDHLYVPKGFDSNDSVELIVSGHFPNACFSRDKVEVEVVNETIQITITALAPESTKRKNRCPQMVVPFKEVISVGNLQGGTYQVVVNDQESKNLKDILIVEEASSNAVDDHLYAAIDQVEHKGNDNYVLHGWRYSNCVDLNEVKVVSNGKDTLSVLPIMKQTAKDCPMKGMPVAYPVKLDFTSINIKAPLIHVRTMDGKSFNKILNVEERK
jgi:hypothetical protein